MAHWFGPVATWGDVVAGMVLALVVGALVGVALGYVRGARRGGPAWMAGFWRGGKEGIRVTLDAFEDRSPPSPGVRFKAVAEAEREGRS